MNIRATTCVSPSGSSAQVFDRQRMVAWGIQSLRRGNAIRPSINEAEREFVANLVPQSMAEAMNITNIDAPPGRNELTLAGLQTTPSATINPPLIAASPVAFECRLVTSLSFNSHQAVIFGEVVAAFVSDDLVLDPARGVIDTPKLDLFGAMHAARWYCTATDRFEMARPTWAQWVKEGKA